MGKPTPSAQDLAERSVAADLTTATGPGSVTDWFEVEGTFNFWLSGSGVGTVILERSYDGGVNGIPVTNIAQEVIYTKPASETLFSRERGVLWRARRTVATSGIFTVRFSQ